MGRGSVAIGRPRGFGTGTGAIGATATSYRNESFVAGDRKFQLHAETVRGAVRDTTVVEIRRRIGARGDWVTAGSAEFFHRDGKLFPNTVNVDQAFRRRGLASRMYSIAERMTGKSVIASHVQTEAGKAFSEAFRGKKK